MNGLRFSEAIEQLVWRALQKNASTALGAARRNREVKERFRIQRRRIGFDGRKHGLLVIADIGQTSLEWLPCWPYLALAP